MWHAILSYPNPTVTGPWHNLLLQMRHWGPNHSGITVSSTPEDIHKHNQSTWRGKGSNLITRFTSQENSNLSWGNSEYLQVWNTTYQHSTWNWRIFYTKKSENFIAVFVKICVFKDVTVGQLVKRVTDTLNHHSTFIVRAKQSQIRLTICQSTWHSIQETWIFSFYIVSQAVLLRSSK